MQHMHLSSTLYHCLTHGILESLAGPTMFTTVMALPCHATPVGSASNNMIVFALACSGAVLQLLDHLPAALAAAAAGPTAAPTPLVYISPAAADALATANSCCEYLERRRQQQVLEQGTAPFAHKQLIKAGQLKILSAAAGAAGATGAAAGDGMQVDVTGASSGTAAAAAEGVSVSGDERVGDGPDWGPVVQEVMSLGPCVVFVPLWSLAAGTRDRAAAVTEVQRNRAECMTTVLKTGVGCMKGS